MKAVPHKKRRPTRNRRMSEVQKAHAWPVRALAWARWSFPWLIGVVGFFGAVFGLHYGFEALCASPRLRIQTIEYRGLGRVKSTDIENYANLRSGAPIMQLDLDAAALGLRKLPWVKTARLQRRLPDFVQVEIKEHEPALLVAIDDLYVANQEGHLFKRLRANDNVVLPILSGLTRQELAIRPKEAAATIKKAVSLYRALSGVRRPLGLVEELHWDKDIGFSVVTHIDTQQPLLQVVLGHDAETRIQLAKDALSGLKRIEKNMVFPEILWVNGEKHPYRAYARVQLASAAGFAHGVQKRLR